MIVFVNNTVVICDPHTTMLINDGYRGVPHYSGEVFTKDEVRCMLDGINHLIDLRKRMGECKHREAYVLTESFSASFMKEDFPAECNYISPRKIKYDTLDSFLNHLPEIMRWL